jgi:rare lipoprotein A
VKLFLLFIVIALYVTGCGIFPKDLLSPTQIESTDTNDGAPDNHKDITLIDDAVPVPVVRTRAGNKSPYTVFGQTYTLLEESAGYQEQGGASWYGTKFHGRYTANGEEYDMWDMTAAHKTLPIPSYVRVTNLENGLSVIVRVNDRGPFHSERIIDLSYAAALKLGFAEKGVAQVDVVDITPVNTQGVPASIAKPSGSVSIALPVAVTPPTPEPAVITPPAPAIVPVDDAPLTYLQVAAFKQQKSANTLRLKLSGLLNVPVIVVPDATNTWYRVRVGAILNGQMLSEAKQILSEQGFDQPQVIKSR